MKWSKCRQWRIRRKGKKSKVQRQGIYGYERGPVPEQGTDSWLINACSVHPYPKYLLFKPCFFPSLLQSCCANWPSCRSRGSFPLFFLISSLLFTDISKHGHYISRLNTFYCLREKSSLPCSFLLSTLLSLKFAYPPVIPPSSLTLFCHPFFSSQSYTISDSSFNHQGSMNNICFAHSFPWIWGSACCDLFIQFWFNSDSLSLTVFYLSFFRFIFRFSSTSF
jgi:hypothetical protein